MSSETTHQSLAERAAQVTWILQEGYSSALHPLLEGLHAGDLALILESLSPYLRAKFIQAIRPHFNPEILPFLDETVREEVMGLLDPQELAAALGALDSDDAFLVIEDLDQDQQEKIFQSITPEERQSLEETLGYPEASAGRLMQKEVVAFRDNRTVDQVKEAIAHHKSLPDVFYDLFVVDAQNHPLGFLPLSRLLTSPGDSTLVQIMTPETHPISVTTDQESVALLFKRYSLLSAPVVNEVGKLVGMITLDDVIDVIDEEAEEDIMHLGGVASSDFYLPFLPTLFARLQWLSVTLLNTLLASAVIDHFKLALGKKVTLGVLMPIVASMGGSAGTQVVTVTVRALSNHSLNQVNMARAILKEIKVSFCNGLICAFFLSVVTLSYYEDPALCVVLAAALVFNMLWAGFGGTVIPLLLSRLDMDPALSAGPLLSTTTDVFGFAIFLGLSMTFLI